MVSHAAHDQPLSRMQAGENSDGHDPHSDFVLMKDVRPPQRIAHARERMLLSRLYIELIRSLNDDYGTAFGSHSDSATYRTIGIYVFLRTVTCSPARVTVIADTLKLPRAVVLRRLQEMVKQGYVERVGNAYRVTDKVNIPDLQRKMQRRIDMIVGTAKELSRLETSTEGLGADAMTEPQ
jgi:DNA-binding MarR family transcriptional regulator